MASTVRPVILSGGAGTRLWPLSTPGKPKQFIDLVGAPLFESTLDRVADLEGAGSPLVVTGGDHLAHVEAALAGSGATARVIIEPEGRNTAPAIVAAALVAQPHDVLLVLPADHLIRDTAGFAARVRDAVAEAVAGSLVLFGVVPTRAETGYGYIETGAASGEGFEVAAFVEKPDPGRAATLWSDGRHLWNSGMFAFTAAAILEECSALQPAIVETVRRSLPAVLEARVELGESFRAAPAISIDHAVMELTRRAKVIPLDVGWSDVGSWQAVWEESNRDQDGNVLIGEVVVKDVTGSYVRSTSRRVAVLGVDDLVVVETGDAVLVVPRAGSQLVREVTDEPRPA